MSKENGRYCLITPCRDELKYARITIESVVRQSVLPDKWVIVDDGSTDGTSELLAEYEARYEWISIISRKNRGSRAVGSGVIEAFYEGYTSIKPDYYDYICKIDLDLDIPVNYFETLILEMEKDQRLGSCSGKPYIKEGINIVPQIVGNEISVGMTKFYRVSCFKQIGGFVREVMWDGIDCHRSRMLGWKTWAKDDVQALRFIHLRPMGSSQNGISTGRMRHGFGQYYMGTGLIYLTISSLYRILEKPAIFGSLWIWWGYVKSMLLFKKRYNDLAFRKFLRRYHWLALTRGKNTAVELVEDQYSKVWTLSRENLPMPI